MRNVISILLIAVIASFLFVNELSAATFSNSDKEKTSCGAPTVSEELSREYEQYTANMNNEEFAPSTHSSFSDNTHVLSLSVEPSFVIESDAHSSAFYEALEFCIESCICELPKKGFRVYSFRSSCKPG